MNSEGSIQRFKNREEALKAGYSVELTDAMFKELEPLSPPERVKRVKEKYPGQATAYMQGAWKGS